MNKLLSTLVLLGMMCSCKPEGHEQIHPVQLADQEVVVFLQGGTDTGESEAVVEVDNSSGKAFKLTQIAMSCDCLRYKGNLPLVLPPSSRVKLTFGIEARPDMTRRGGDVILKLEDGRSLLAKIRVQRGFSLELAPLAITSREVANSPTECSQTAQFYGAVSDDFMLKGQVVGERSVPGYSLSVKVLERRPGWALLELKHQFAVGLPLGDHVFEVNINLDDRVLATTSIRTIGLGPGFIEPSLVLCGNGTDAKTYNATLNVPWLMKASPVAGFLRGREIDCNWTAEGSLQITVPADLIPKGVGFDIVDGSLVAGAETCPFRVAFARCVLEESQ